MKRLVLLFVAILNAGCGENPSSEGSESGSENSKSLSDTDINVLEEAIASASLQERNGLLYRFGESEPYNGWAKSMYDSGQVKGLASVRSGKASGLSTTWHKNGQKAWEVTYEDGAAVFAKYWNSKGEEVETEEEALGPATFDFDNADYSDFLAIAGQMKLFGPHQSYETQFKLEVVEETRVSESRLSGTNPTGKSLAVIGLFGRNVLGEQVLNGTRFDMDSYVETLKDLVKNSDELPGISKSDVEILSFLRNCFDYIYIKYADPVDGNIRSIDIQEVLRSHQGE